jgi:hypothetical protein
MCVRLVNNVIPGTPRMVRLTNTCIHISQSQSLHEAVILTNMTSVPACIPIMFSNYRYCVWVIMIVCRLWHLYQIFNVGIILLIFFSSDLWDDISCTDLIEHWIAKKCQHVVKVMVHIVSNIRGHQSIFFISIPLSLGERKGGGG